MSAKHQITVYDVVALATDDGEWVDGEFQAVVRNATAKQGNKPSKADLCDPDSPNIKVKASAFGNVDFTDLLGATCLFSGKGMKVKIYKGVAELNLSDKAVINVVTAAPAGQGRPAMAPANPSVQGGRRLAPPPAITPAEQASKFHRTLKKQALLWLHAYQYASDIEAKLGVVLPADLRQSVISSMFITAKDQGLLDIVPALREVKDGKLVPFVAPKVDAPDPEEAARKAAEAAEEARRRHEAEEAAKRELDEDVPF